MSDKDGREAARLATLEYLDAVRPETDGILQKLVDDVRGVFGTELCLVNLALAETLYHRAWSGNLSYRDRKIPMDHSTCLDVVEAQTPLVVEDFRTDERFSDHQLFTIYGIRFYAGAPLTTSYGVTIGTLCLLDSRPREFDEARMITLEAFARAVVERLELLGSLGREQATREREARRGRELQEILDTSPDIIATISLDGEFESVNPACKAILGYEPEELIGSLCMGLVHPEDREITTKTVRAVAGGKPLTGFENRYLRKNGGLAWIEWNATPLPEEGTILWIGRDITERKRAEEKLRLRDRAIAASSNGIIITDPNQKDNPIVYVNPSFERITGYAAGEAVGRNCRFLAGDDRDQPALEELRVAMREGREWSGILRNYRKDGTLFWNEMHIAPVWDEDGRLTSFIGVQNDITERKRAEEKIHFQARLLDAVGQAVIAIDLWGRIIYWSRSAETLYGWSAREVTGCPVGKVIVSEDRQEQAAGIMSRLRAGRSWSGEFVVRHRDGTLFPVMATDTPVHDEQGNLVGMIGVSRDITERKRAETLANGQKHVLELIATGAPLPDVLEALARIIEEHSREMLCSILLLDENGTNLRFGAGPSLPDSYTRVMDGMAVGPSEGSCGTAAYRGEAVIVSDTASDPLWAEYRDLALDHGLRACWSTPILSGDGHVLGTFAMYYHEPRSPGLRDLQLIAVATHIAGIAIERKRAEKALRESEERFRALVQNSSDLVVVSDANGALRYVSPSVEWVLGYKPEELVGLTAKNVFDHVHPDDVERVRLVTAQARSNPGANSPMEFRLRHTDGSWRCIEAISTNLLDEPSVRGMVFNGRDVTERKRAEEELKESHDLLQAVMEGTTDAVFVKDLEGRYLTINRAGAEALGKSAEEVIDKDDTELFSAEDGREVMEEDREVLTSGETRTIEDTKTTAEGETRTYSVTRGPYRDGKGDIAGLFGVSRDITERKKAEEALRRSERDLSTAQRVARVGNWRLRFGEAEETWSDELYRILGVTRERVAPTFETLMGFVHPGDRGLLREAFGRPLPRGERDRTEFRIVRAGGETRFVEAHREFEYDEAGVPVGMIGTVQDVTERKTLEDRLEHQAFHDPLTDLPNRALLLERLGHALTRTDRRKESVAVLFLDLDNFKVVNDSLGHEAGNRLLVAVAGRLRACLRPGDTAARLGGDEFVVLLEEIKDESEATQVAERLVRELREPFALGDHEVKATTSIGVVLGNSGADRPEDLLRDADVAMYEAKNRGKDHHRVFSASMRARALGRLKLETELRQAIERGEFRTYYQPAVRLTEDPGQRLRSRGNPTAAAPRIVKMEALLRWEHPERGLVLPSEFVALAEETGLIIPIGQWMIREACRKTREWQERYPSSPPLAISVNLSARQFQNPDLGRDTAQALRETGLNPHCLILEITESVVMEEARSTIETLEELRGLGVRLAVDDFGTGYSSLSYLKRFPVDFLKIDRSFIKGLEDRSEDAVLVLGITGLAHALGLKVVAEGVENAGQIARLRETGCDLAQGYFFSKPLPGKAADALLARRRA